MILILALALSLLGFIGWITGSIFDLPGIAVIGALFVVGVGAMVMQDGLQHRTGQIENQTSNNTTSVEYTYGSVETPTPFPLGEMWLLFGAAMTLQSLTRFNR